jgi:putative tryptophan/tyrosine transport system substrate-binding protein
MGAILVAWPLVGGAQRPEKIHRVGLLLFGASTSVPADLMQELRDLGYVEGRNIEFEVRSVGGELGRFSELGAELLRSKIDLLVTTNTRAAQAVANLTKTVPIVVIASGDLVGTGLAASLARPGGNVTGLTALSPELSAKRLELLKEVVPGLKRVAVLWNPDGPAPVRAFKEIQAASRLLGLEILSLEVRVPGDIGPAFAALARGRAQGLQVINDPLITGNIATIVKLAAERRVPTVFPSRAFVDAGGLIAYGPNYAEMYRRSAHYVDRLLKGAKPSDLPIEQPIKFELAINAKTAKALGLTIPRSVLSKADAVIE